MYKVLSAKKVDFTDNNGRHIEGNSIYVMPTENASPYVFYGVEPVKVFLPSSVVLPQFRDNATYQLLYDMFGSKPRVVGIVEVK